MIGLPGSIASSVLVALWLISDFLQLQTLPVLRFHNAWNRTTGMKESGFKLNSSRERGCNGGFLWKGKLFIRGELRPAFHLQSSLPLLSLLLVSYALKCFFLNTRYFCTLNLSLGCDLAW